MTKNTKKENCRGKTSEYWGVDRWVVKLRFRSTSEKDFSQMSLIIIYSEDYINTLVYRYLTFFLVSTHIFAFNRYTRINIVSHH